MTTTIGGLNVKVSASSAGVAEEMSRNAAAFEQFGRSVARSSAQVQSAASGGGGSSRLSRGFLELSRGAEDFSSVYGTMGVAGAMRAASNNVSQFAAIVHPAAGAVTGLGIALGTVLIPKLFDTAKAAAQLKRDIESVDASYKRFEQSVANAEGLRAFGREAAKMLDPKDVGEKFADIRNQIADTESKIGDLAKARNQLGKDLVRAPEKTELKGFGIGGVGAADLTDAEKKRNAAINENLNKLSEQILKERDRKDQLEKQLDILRQQAKVATERANGQDLIKKQEEAEKARHEALAESNRRLEKSRQIQAEILGELDEEAARRQRIRDIERDRQKAIQSAPISQEEKDRLSLDAAKSRDKQLAALDAGKLQGVRDQVKARIDQLEKARGIVPVQEALQRGSAGAVSFANRTSSKPAKDPQLEDLKKQLEKLNRQIADKLGKPVELVQGHL